MDTFTIDYKNISIVSEFPNRYLSNIQSIKIEGIHRKVGKYAIKLDNIFEYIYKMKSLQELIIKRCSSIILPYLMDIKVHSLELENIDIRSILELSPEVTYLTVKNCAGIKNINYNSPEFDPNY